MLDNIHYYVIPLFLNLTVCVQVVDRVCTADGVLDREPLRLGDGAKIKEVPVWGIDCYTRRY